jgi:predicted Zn-dependent peptidase
VTGRGLVAGGALLLALGGPPAGHAGPGAVRADLANGMTVLVNENPTVPALAASLFVRAGARWETEEQAGITNLLQQTMVKGTDRHSALEIVEATERIGGSLGVSVEPDFAEIRGTALSRHWRSLLALVAEVALRPSLPDAEIATERKAALTAVRSRGDQPFQRALDTLLERLFDGHPYSKPSVGRARVIEGITRTALAEHHRRFYRPHRMILSVSGQVRAPDVVAEAEKLFGGGPALGPDRSEAIPAPRARSERLELSHPAAQAQVLFGFIAPPLGHADYAPVKVLTTILGGGMAGRLFVQLRDREGLAYATGAVYPSREHPSFVLAYAGTAPKNAARAEAGLRRELERMRAEPPSPAELARARAYLLGQFLLDRRTNARLAWYQALYESTGVGQDFPERYAAAVESVSVQDIRRVADTYLASPSVVVLAPPVR